MTKMMTAREISPLTIYRVVRSGKLPAFRVGGAWRFDRDAIERWRKADGTPRLIAHCYVGGRTRTR